MNVCSFGVGVPLAKSQTNSKVVESTAATTQQNSGQNLNRPSPTKSKLETDSTSKLNQAPLANSRTPATKPNSKPNFPQPPRVDGAYLGPSLNGFALFAQIDELDNQEALAGGSAWIRVGEVVFPWLSIGIQAGGGMAYNDPQKATQWGFLIEFGFYPTPRYPWSLRASFGTGGGAIRDPRKPNKRFGYGGAIFQAGARYEWFPLATRNRATRAGGWAIGPEIGWLGFPPSAKGKDMAHSPYLSLTTSFYFGR